jgi:hypothetical protein
VCVSCARMFVMVMMASAARRLSSSCDARKILSHRAVAAAATPLATTKDATRACQCGSGARHGTAER